MDATKAHGPYRGFAAHQAARRRLLDAGARRVRIGTSVDGEPLWSLELGPADADVAVALIAGIHPIEWIGVETGLAALEALAADPPDDRRVIAFPLVNVDGYRQVEANLAAGRRRFVRTNTNGVDLNRNWPVHHRAGTGLTSRIGGWNRGGPAPLSEPEIEAVVGRLDEVAADARITRAISLHSIGRRILFPYGGRWAPPADADAHRAAADALRAHLSRPYKVSQTSHWVPGLFAYGLEIDTLHDRYGALALLVECSWGGASLRRPASLIQPFRWFNPPRPEGEIRELAAGVREFLCAPS